MNSNNNSNGCSACSSISCARLVLEKPSDSVLQSAFFTLPISPMKYESTACNQELRFNQTNNFRCFLRSFLRETGFFFLSTLKRIIGEEQLKFDSAVEILTPSSHLYLRLQFDELLYHRDVAELQCLLLTFRVNSAKFSLSSQLSSGLLQLMQCNTYPIKYLNVFFILVYTYFVLYLYIGIGKILPFQT